MLAESLVLLPILLGRWRRRALTPLNRQIETKNGLWAGRVQNFDDGGHFRN